MLHKSVNTELRVVSHNPLLHIHKNYEKSNVFLWRVPCFMISPFTDYTTTAVVKYRVVAVRRLSVLPRRLNDISCRLVPLCLVIVQKKEFCDTIS